MRIVRLLLAVVLFVGMAALPVGCGGGDDTNGEKEKVEKKVEDVKGSMEKEKEE
jgi:hypothetical protein